MLREETDVRKETAVRKEADTRKETPLRKETGVRKETTLRKQNRTLIDQILVLHGYPLALPRRLGPVPSAKAHWCRSKSPLLHG